MHTVIQRFIREGFLERRLIREGDFLKRRESRERGGGGELKKAEFRKKINYIFLEWAICYRTY